MLPFQALIGGLAALTGLLALVDVGGTSTNVISEALPGWLNMYFNLSYGVAGLAMLAALWLPRRDLEAASLILIASNVVVRSLVTYFALGLVGIVLVAYAFNLMILLACVARLRTIIRGEVLLPFAPQKGE